MKIEHNNVRKIFITDIYKSHNLDPVSIYLEDFELGKGKITISCYDKTWHSYWGGMSGRTISEFFLSCDNGYIAKNLSRISPSIPDYEALYDKIIEYYGEEDIDYFVKDEMRQLQSCQDEGRDWVMNNSDIMEEVFGCDWFYDVPEMENPKYKYLCEIIDVVKEVLRKTEGNNEKK